MNSRTSSTNKFSFAKSDTATHAASIYEKDTYFWLPDLHPTDAPLR